MRQESRAPCATSTGDVRCRASAIPTARAARPRPRASRARRQPHRPRLHRRRHRLGDFLMRAMHAHGFANIPTSQRADDGLVLTDAYIAAAVRCAPPDNKPTPDEIAACHAHLVAEVGGAAEPARRRMSRKNRVRCGLASARVDAASSSAATAVRSRRVVSDGWPDRDRLVSPEPAEHEHRKLTPPMLRVGVSIARERAISVQSATRREAGFLLRSLRPEGRHADAPFHVMLVVVVTRRRCRMLARGQPTSTGCRRRDGRDGTRASARAVLRGCVQAAPGFDEFVLHRGQHLPVG